MPKYVSVALVGISLVFYFFISFFVERYDTAELLLSYAVLFTIYIIFLRDLNTITTNQILVIAVLFRMVVFVALPTLSDDFYRFIWDGRVLSAGANPFENLPAEYLGTVPNLSSDLYYKLNSPDYYTVYPPLVQFIFLISTSLFPNDIYASVLVMKAFSFAAEIGILIMMIKILLRMNLPTRYISIYALNPLIVLEIVGNLHHEGIMLFFLLFAIYFLLKNRFISSAAMWALAVATKLIPLIFLPLLLFRISFKNLLKFGSMLLIISVVLFFPLIEGMQVGLPKSLSLYFTKFEFNASFYYVIRELGYWVKGYNIIQTAGPFMALTVFILIMLYSFFLSHEKNLFNSMTWVYLIFVVFSTTVHPWYSIGLIAFSVFTGYLFPVVWSFLIFMTYAGYTVTGFEENLYIVLLEYSIVAGIMIFELRRKDEKPLLYKFINFDRSAHYF